MIIAKLKKIVIDFFLLNQLSLSRKKKNCKGSIFWNSFQNFERFIGTSARNGTYGMFVDVLLVKKRRKSLIVKASNIRKKIKRKKKKEAKNDRKNEVEGDEEGEEEAGKKVGKF
uniref:Uncharacterized protein n=1 Tax=Onchocerca volvulus TaxID=6282 RepID=A0A8R1TPJ6_ONCVO